MPKLNPNARLVVVVLVGAACGGAAALGPRWLDRWLMGIVDAVLAANADAVAEYREGDDKARKKKREFLMGEAMKASKGQGNPQLLNRLLDERLG